MQKVILAVSNDITTDQRLHKVCTTLKNAGFEVLLVGRKRKTSIHLEKREYSTYRMPLWFDSGKFFYLELNIRLFFFLMLQKANIVTANDLDTLLPCYLASKLKGSKLVYDSHEYYTEVPELAHRPLEKRIWTFLEKSIFPRLKRVSTVASSIADIYHQKYGVPISVIRNLPIAQELDLHPVLKNKILIYQGAVNMGRGIELMMDTMPLLPNYNLWIVGDGSTLEELRKKNHSSNVKFWGRIPFEKLSSITVQAAIGLSLEEDLGLNYRFALPNKLFDYVHCQVPIICSDLPEMRAVVQQNKVGEVLYDRTPQGLALLVNRMMDNAEHYKHYQNHCKKAASLLTWQHEEATLLALYR